MELNDAAHRILGRHWRLIATFLCLGIALAGLIHLGSSKTYTASTRLVLDTPDPKTFAEAGAIADTAKGLATSPSLVKRALAKAGVTGRDPDEVAKHRVTVQPLGGSGVLRLSLSDENSRAAAATANALAAQVISKRLDVTNGQLRDVVSGVGRRIDALSREVSRLDTKISSLQAAGAQPATSSRLARLLRQRDLLVQQRGVLESTRSSTLSTDAERPAASVVSPASVPANADSSGFLPDIVLGAILGAVLGVGVAAFREGFRPTLMGGHALAKELDAPLLGTLSTDPSGKPRANDVTRIAGRLQLAAKAAGVRSVQLIGLRDDLDLPGSTDLDDLARRLDGLAPTPDREPVAAASHAGTSNEAEALGEEPMHSEAGALAEGGQRARVRVFDSNSLALTNGGGMRLALVAPATVKKAELDELRDLVRVSPGGLLGVVTYTSPAKEQL